MKLNRVHHIAIITADYERSKSFYTNLLGFTILNEYYREERDSYKLDLAFNGEYLIELFSFPSPPKRLTYPEACGLRHLAFEVDDIDQCVLELQRKGVEVGEVRMDPYTNKKTVFFNDPDNLPLELYEKTPLEN
jgi:glyoxylase I family protein